MKTTKRIFACLLIVVMLASMLCVGASAVYQTSGGTITITNATSGVTYYAYKVLDMEINTTTGAYRYEQTPATSGADWNDFVAAQTAYFTVSGKYVTAKYADAAAIAQIAEQYVSANTIADTANVTATGTTASITGLDCGYYLITSSDGTVIGLDTLLPKEGTPELSLNLKSGLPSIVKSVDDTAVGIGDTTTYTITVTTEQNGKDYTIVDELPTGTYDPASLSVQVGGVDVAASNYVVTPPANAGDPLTIVLKESYLQTLLAATEIVITYEAAVTSAINTAGAPNKNTATLYYGVDADASGKGDLTKSAATTIYSYDLVVTKTFDGAAPAAGVTAGFKLMNTSGKYAVVTAGKITSWDNDGTEQITDADGKITFAALGDGTYTLVETTVPAGYVGAANKDIPITNANAAATVDNTSGNELPDTGGMGTTVFYAAGGILVLGALVVLLMKKRSVTE